MDQAEVVYRVTILTDAESWLHNFLPTLIADLQSRGHSVNVVTAPAEVPEGDFLLCLSSTRLVPSSVLARNRHNLVVHQSDLPRGRGWSPLSWQILEGKDVVPVCLFEAASRVDSGPIYLRDEMHFKGTELVDELRHAQAACAFQMVMQFFDEYPGIIMRGVPQSGDPTYYPRRSPEDNRIDPDKTLREQFNLLRIVDNERYPAYVELYDEVYILKIEKSR
jgi:methionyl-tRNA formyltransferase